MASYKPIMQFEAELRQCKVKGKNAFFHKWAEYRATDGKMESHVTVGIVEYVEDGKVDECFTDEIQFLDTKGKAMGYCWDLESDETDADDYKTALVIGKTKQDAEKMVKNLWLVGYKKIITRGEGGLNNLDGIKADRVYIYDDCSSYAKSFAQAFVQSVKDGEVWVIKREENPALQVKTNKIPTSKGYSG